MMRNVLQKIIDWIRDTIDRNRNKSSQNRKWANTSEMIEFIKRKLGNCADDSSTKPLVILLHSMDMGILKA